MGKPLNEVTAADYDDWAERLGWDGAFHEL